MTGSAEAARPPRLEAKLRPSLLRHWLSVAAIWLRTGVRPMRHSSYTKRITGRHWLAKWRTRKFLSAPPPADAPWLAGLRILTDNPSGAGRLVHAAGTYEPCNLFVLARLLRPGDVVFDIGANVGLITLFAARRVGPRGHVVAFEPSPRERAVLERNIRRNGFDHVTIVEAAASDAPGRLTLQLAAEAQCGLNTLATAFPQGNPGLAPITVEAVTLDRYFEMSGLQRLDFIKIDAEGWEHHVLLGARTILTRMRPLILLEYTPAALALAGTSAEALAQTLRQVGYCFCAIEDGTGRLVPIQAFGERYSRDYLLYPAPSASKDEG